uniref:Uncharacterized protein n=1 Tax=Sus scrofa TaxID=9823 RepID=A0A4X1TZC0_PIG
MLLPGHARPLPAPQPAQHPGLRRQVEPPGQLLRLFYCTVLVCSKEISALTDFSDELKNKTVCEDHELKLHCHESKYLNIYSATYGRRTQERDVCSSEAGRLPPFGTCFYVTVIRMLLERLGLWLPQERGHAMAGTWIRRKVKGRGQPPISGSCLLLPVFPNPVGVPWWLSGLRIQRRLCCGSGYCSGVGSIPGSRNFCLPQMCQKKIHLLLLIYAE